MVAGGLFNAVAFAGAGYLFQTFNKHDYDEERKRHDLALEKIAALRRQRADANEELKSVNKSFKDYDKVTTLVFEGKKFTRQPHVWDFYNPSDEMKEYMTLSIGAMGLLGGWTGQKIISKLLL